MFCACCRLQAHSGPKIFAKHVNKQNKVPEFLAHTLRLSRPAGATNHARYMLAPSHPAPPVCRTRAMNV